MRVIELTRPFRAIRRISMRPAAVRELSAAGAGASVPGPVVIVKQPKNSKWCWAAVAVGVAQTYDGMRHLCQCEVAIRVVGGDCCQGIDPNVCEDDNTSIKNCNQAAALEDALAATGNGVKNGVQSPPLVFADLQKEIDTGRIVCFREKGVLKEGHFVYAVGYGVPIPGCVTVVDPLDGVIRHPYYDGPDGFRSGCDDSYKTKPLGAVKGRQP
ncbi:MAG TPA: hypothetical protein VHR45_19850 [Thermoanaerobaculia bacterium]|nr:hypothetical protein [Thermoanaerobaculia bacterium]